MQSQLKINFCPSGVDLGDEGKVNDITYELLANPMRGPCSKGPARDLKSQEHPSFTEVPLHLMCVCGGGAATVTGQALLR